MSQQATLPLSTAAAVGSSRPASFKKPRHDVVRQITQTTQYRRDLKRELKTDPALIAELNQIVELLVTRQPLPAKLRDHRMWGTNRDFRDLHVRPDLVLVYMPGKTDVTLVRLGSHSELF